MTYYGPLYLQRTQSTCTEALKERKADLYFLKIQDPTPYANLLPNERDTVRLLILKTLYFAQPSFNCHYWFRNCVSFHHIIMDGWRIRMIISEFNEIYNAWKKKENASHQTPSLHVHHTNGRKPGPGRVSVNTGQHTRRVTWTTFNLSSQTPRRIIMRIMTNTGITLTPANTSPKSQAALKNGR